MAAWLIRVIGEQRKDIDAYLVAQAVIAYARQLWEQEQAKREAGSKTGSQEAQP